MNDLWNAIKRHVGLTAPWEVAALSRVAVDPVSSRVLTHVFQPVPTIRLRAEREEQAAPADRLELIWHGITDTGMARQRNEDSLAHLATGDCALFVVADGMGGHDAGERASSLAVETVVRTVTAGCRWNEDPLSLVERSVSEANHAVRQEARQSGSNMGTTLAVGLVSGRTAYIANVGDSRVYWQKDGLLRQITEDHSLVARLVAAGKLTTDEARTDQRSHLLYRSVGSEDQLPIDTFSLPLEQGGTLLLCSDGLWGEVDDADLARTLAEEDRTEAICARLVQQANSNGGRDNITAIAVKVV